MPENTVKHFSWYVQIQLKYWNILQMFWICAPFSSTYIHKQSLVCWIFEIIAIIYYPTLNYQDQLFGMKPIHQWNSHFESDKWKHALFVASIVRIQHQSVEKTAWTGTVAATWHRRENIQYRYLRHATGLFTNCRRCDADWNSSAPWGAMNVYFTQYIP